MVIGKIHTQDFYRPISLQLSVCLQETLGSIYSMWEQLAEINTIM